MWATTRQNGAAPTTIVLKFPTLFNFFYPTENRPAIADMVVLLTDGFPTMMLDGSTFHQDEVKNDPAKRKMVYDEVREKVNIYSQQPLPQFSQCQSKW